MIRYVGIDLHKRLLVAHILDEKGQTVTTAKINVVNKISLKHFCEKYFQKQDHVAMEVTTHCWAVVRFIEPYVEKVVVSNPMATKAIAEAKVKTDKVDAAVLANLLRLDYLPSVWIPDAELSLLRELSGRRNQLIRDRTKLICRIRSTLAMRLLDCPFEIVEDRGRAWIKSVEMDSQCRSIVDSDLRLIDTLQIEIDAIDKQTAQRVYQDKRVLLLMTLPGVSQNVAQSVVAAIGDISRFPTPEKLASYLGLVPTTRQSATKCYHGKITKAGNVDARWALVQAAHCARNDQGPLGYFFNKVNRRKSYNVAVVAVARKLAMLAWHILSSGLPYRYAKPSSVEAKLSRLRVAGSGQRRKSGVDKGVDPRVMREKEDQNMKRTPSLVEVLRKEGIDPPPPLKPGEKKMLENTQTLGYFESLQNETVRAKAVRNKTAPKEENALAEPTVEAQELIQRRAATVPSSKTQTDKSKPVSKRKSWKTSPLIQS